MGSESESNTATAEFTIDELAAASGVPSRTIRFYQAKGVLPAPRKRGRVAMYDPSHLERLRLISELQDRGLRLRAIRDVLSRPEATNETVHEWLGVRERVDSFVEDAPQLVTEEELRQLLGQPAPGVIKFMQHNGLIERQGEGSNVRFLVPSPLLLQVAVDLGAAGISLEVAQGLRNILERRLARAADELVNYAIQHIGRGFGHSAEAKDVATAVEALLPSAPGGMALRAIFAREINRAVEAQMHEGAMVLARHASRHRRTHRRDDPNND